MLGYKYIAQCEQYIAYGTHVLHKVIPVFVVLFSFAPIIPISIYACIPMCEYTCINNSVYFIVRYTCNVVVLLSVVVYSVWCSILCWSHCSLYSHLPVQLGHLHHYLVHSSL